MTTYSASRVSRVKFGECPECGRNRDMLIYTCDDFDNFAQFLNEDDDCLCYIPKCMVSILCCGLLAFPYAVTRFLCCACSEKASTCCTATRLSADKIITAQPKSVSAESATPDTDTDTSKPQSEV